MKDASSFSHEAVDKLLDALTEGAHSKYLKVMAEVRCKIRSCSIGINHFRLVGLVELFRVLLAKNRFRLVWLLNFFNPYQTRLKRLKKHW